MHCHIVRSSEIQQSARVMQLSGIFDVPPSKKSVLEWDHVMPIEDRDWNVGLIVGPSGCGKSTMAREMFPEAIVSGYEWPGDSSLVDAFPQGMSIKDITMLLSSVGFSSPPSWVRPFGVLSTGEQFRVTVARALAENTDKLLLIDEFTSVVDRTVAQLGSNAIAKSVRRRGQKFIAVTCHYDLLEWLQPDWIYDPSTCRFQWRELCRRPPINLTISRVHHDAWKVFAKHHYLTASLSHSAWCFVAFLDGKIPVAFDAWLPFFGRTSDDRPARRGHRTVCLPDYQGVGIGNALFTFVASMWAGLGFRCFSTTGHPAEIAHRIRSANWRMSRAPGKTAADANVVIKARATNRFTAGFEYTGPAMNKLDAYVALNSWGKVSP